MPEVHEFAVQSAKSFWESVAKMEADKIKTNEKLPVKKIVKRPCSSVVEQKSVVLTTPCSH